MNDKAMIPTERSSSGRVHVLGEMVALLWSEGNGAATIRLESLLTAS